MANYEHYHGLVLREITKLPEGAHIKAHDIHGIINCFIVNNRVGLYIKHSAKRISPWVFGFSGDNLTEIQLLEEEATMTFVSLVCGYDGFLTMSKTELESLASKKKSSNTLNVHVRRRKRHMYAVGGRHQLERNKTRGLSDAFVQALTK